MGDKILNILNSTYEGWTVEHRFDSVNRYRFDYAHLKMRIAIEIEGGIYTGTGHAKTGTYLKDMRKYNLAQLKGWIILRYATGQEHLIADDIKRAIEKREKEKIEKEKLIEKDWSSCQ